MKGFLKISIAQGLLALAFLPATFSAARNADLENVELPVQNYAVIDLSGSVQGSNPIDQVALNDQNEIAFSWWNGDQYMVARWAQGSLREAPQATGRSATFVERWLPAHESVLSASAAGPDTTPFMRRINSKGDVATAGVDPTVKWGEMAAFWKFGETVTSALEIGDHHSNRHSQWIFCLTENDLMINCEGWFDRWRGTPSDNSVLCH